VKQASESDLKGLLEYNTEPLVSSDFNHNPASSIFDATLTRVSERHAGEGVLVVRQRVGLLNRMLDVAGRLRRSRKSPLAK